jgi:hypothetical protein
MEEWVNFGLSALCSDFVAVVAVNLAIGVSGLGLTYRARVLVCHAVKRRMAYRDD